MSELPQGWVEAELGSLTVPSRPRRDPQQYDHLPYVGMEQVEQQTRRLLSTLPARELRSTAIHFQPGDVLYGRLRPYLNKVLYADFEGLCSSEFIVLPPTGALIPQYLAFFLNTDAFVTYANGLNQGDRPRVSFDQIRNYLVPVPPITEQRRIVAILEQVLARVNACRMRLEEVPILLNRFRQSVLTAACSDRLTEDWREENEHSDGWQDTTLGKLASFITSGSRGWASYYSDTGPLFIRSQDINTDTLILDAAAHVQPPAGAEGARTRIKKGDLLITITGANVTKAAAVECEPPEAYINQHVGLVRLSDIANAGYLHTWLTSPAHGRAQLLEAAYGAGKPGLNLDNLRNVTVCLPSPDEQQEISRRVTVLLTLADQVDACYAQAKTHVDRLTQSILAKAFRGELVPQDPNDEPADVLLARIQAELTSSSRLISMSGKRATNGRKAKGSSPETDREE